MTHAELEDRLSADARELFRQLFQDHLDLRAEHEERLGDWCLSRAGTKAADPVS